MLTVGAKVKYIKTHEGHQGTVASTVHNHKGELAKVGMRCQCGANLWLNPQDVEEMQRCREFVRRLRAIP